KDRQPADRAAFQPALDVGNGALAQAGIVDHQKIERDAAGPLDPARERVEIGGVGVRFGRAHCVAPFRSSLKRFNSRTIGCTAYHGSASSKGSSPSVSRYSRIAAFSSNAR